MRTLLLRVLVVAALTGCASTATSAGTATPARTPRPIQTLPNGSLVPDPGLREAKSPDPNFDYGYVVQITTAGVHPQTLLSGCCLPVTWRNLTGQPVTIVFDHQQVNSGPIPPGGTWVFVPHNAESVTYHTAGAPAFNGVLQVQQTFDS